MHKLDLEKVEEPEIKLPTSVGALNKQGNSRKKKKSHSASLTMLKSLTLSIIRNWTILKEMGITNQLICLLRNLFAGQEAAVRTIYGKTEWFKIGNGLCHGCILSSCLFNLYAECIMWNARLDKAQVRIKTAGRNSNNLRYADDTTLMVEREQRGIKEPLHEDEREWKSFLKTQHSKNEDLDIQAHHFKANRWGKKWKR